MMLQTIQSVLPTVQATVPEVEGSIQGEPMETEDTPAIPPPQNASFPRALKTFLSMKPDSYDGSGEPVQMAYWFSHIEQLMENISCSEAEKVRMASFSVIQGYFMISNVKSLG